VMYGNATLPLYSILVSLCCIDYVHAVTVAQESHSDVGAAVP